MNIQTPATLRRAFARTQATRLLFAGGIPPLRTLVERLGQVFLPSADPASPTSQPIELRPGDPLNDAEIVQVARALQEDTDTLSNWNDHAVTTIESEYLKREVRRKTIERRIFQLKARAEGLSQFSLSGSSKGAGSAGILVDFTNLKMIDFSRTTADIVPAGGPTGDGEATLARNPMKSKALDSTEFRILRVEGPEQIKILGRVENLLTKDSSEPFQAILPGDASGEIRIVLQLNSHKLPVSLSGFELEGINKCTVRVELSNNDSTWDRAADGILMPLGRTVLRFARQPAAYAAIILSVPNKTSPGGGEAIGLRTLRAFEAYYTDSSVLVTPALLQEAAPLQGVEVTVLADVPSDATVDVEVSFTGPDSGYLKTQRVASQANGTKFAVWNPLVTREEISYDTALPPFDNSRFYELPASSEQVVLWDSELFVGVNQWYVEGRPTNNAELDYPYKIPSLDDWEEAAHDRYDSGAVFPTYNYPSLSGNVSDTNFGPMASGIFSVNGFVFVNDHSYGLEETTRSMALVAFDGVNQYMQPGWEYRLSTWVHCQEETAIKLSAMAPGADWGGGTLCFSYNINGKAVLSVGENQVEDLPDWLPFQANTSFTAGWNKIEILIHRPAQTKELAPTTFACVRFSFDPLSDESRRLYSITQMRYRQEPLSRVSEFNLRVLRTPGNRAAWAWRDGSDRPDIILGSDWGHNPDAVIFDGISKGVGSNFKSAVRLGTPESAPACWIRAYLRGSDNLPPRIKSIRVDAL